MALKIPTKEKAIKYAKVIAIIGISLFVVSLIRKQIRRKGLLRGFGDFKTITKDDRGNAGYKAGEVVPFYPKPYAQNLYIAMKGLGTWPDMIWGALDNLSQAEREEVRIYFNNSFGEGYTLMQWFDGDLSGSDLRKAKGYFTTT